MLEPTPPPAVAVFTVATADDMTRLGALLAPRLRAGDVIIATGELGAGKTVLAQGVGAGLGVAGPVVSPTFVLARLHRGHEPGPGLLHVDAYRLASAAELEDIDLDYSMSDNVTFIEWGAGLAEGLSDERLEIGIERTEDVRTVAMTPVGRRWQDVDWTDLVDEYEGTAHG